MAKNRWLQRLSLTNKPALKKTLIVFLLTMKWLIIAFIISGFLATGVVFGYVSALVKDDPIRSKDFIMEQMGDNAITGFVYFNDDSVVGQLRSDEDRRLINLNEIPQTIIDATLSIEDRNFYTHSGIDINGLIRAVKQRFLHEEVQTGGSTITQQVARRVFLNLDREDSRKFKEILLSLRLTRILSKDEILTAYLNKIPYGNGSTGYNVYGIKAAAKGIFDKDDLSQLNVAQSAYLAGLPQLPSNYSAFSSKGEFDSQAFKRAVKRQQLVLERMLEDKKITNEQYQEALKFDLKSSLAQTKQKAYTTYPYLMIDVEKQATDILLKQQYPNLQLDTNSKKDAYNEAFKDIQTQLLHGGYKIYTTIDKTIYDFMHDIVSDNKNFSPDDPKKGMEQVGAVMIENKTGAILGMIEGRDFNKEQLNHATQAYRQPGSAMKPIAAFLPAIEKGVIQPASVIDDVPIILPDGTKGFHIPQNWDTDFHGLITARKALNQSYNIPAIRIFLYDVGIKEAWDFAKKMGINSITKEDYYAQTGVIGGLSKGVSVKEMTNAYATIADKGVFNEAYMIRKIVDADGKTVYEHEKKPAKVFSEQTSYLMTDMMRTVISEGTATDLMTKFKHYNKIAVVGKTGSTQDDTDAWFMGYSPDITLGVWAGYDQPVYKLSKATGGTFRAKNIWALVMDGVIDKKPDLFPTTKFVQPPDIVERTVSNLSGKIPSELITTSGHLVTDIFYKNSIPTQEDDVMVKMKYITYNKINYIPQPGTPSDFLEEKIMIKRAEPISGILKKIKEIMDKLPEDKKKPIDGFIPLDVTDDAPGELDPRTDDGLVPAAPVNVVLTRSLNVNRLSFSPTAASDVVGYRLYASMNKGPFKRLAGKVILTGQEPIFTDLTYGEGTYGYFVTAVDVAGRESAPSKVAFTDGTQLQGSLPSAPSGLTLTLKGISLSVNWKPNALTDKITQYNIYFSNTENGTYQKIGSSTSNEYLYIAGIYNGYYRVSALNALGESQLSASVQFHN